MATGNPVRIVQISDIHLYADKNQALLGVETLQSFTQVVDLLKADKTQPSMILLTGDLSQDHSETSYLTLATILSTFPIPIYYASGNHDDGKVLARIFPYKNISNLKQIILDHWQIILLDSQKTGAVEGFLDKSQLNFLEKCLETYPEHHALIAFHHQPIPVGCKWLDKLGLENTAELWSILERFPKANTVLFGHIHQEYEGKKHHIKIYATPSTCIQFKRNSDEFALEEIPQGYRWVDLFADGEVKSGVSRLEKYAGEFDINAKGY